MLKAYLLLNHNNEFHTLRTSSKGTVLLPICNINSPIFPRLAIYNKISIEVKLTTNEVKLNLLTYEYIFNNDILSQLSKYTRYFPYTYFYYQENDIADEDNEIKIEEKMIIKQIIIAINDNNIPVRELINWSFTIDNNTVFDVDDIYAEYFDKIKMNIKIPSSFPIYTYTFQDSLSLFNTRDVKMNIKTTLKKGKIKILFVCEGVVSYGSGMILFPY
jgi:hypothetical protein